MMEQLSPRAGPRAPGPPCHFSSEGSATYIRNIPEKADILLFFSLVTNLGYLTWNLQKNDSILERIAHIFSGALNSLMT